MKASEFKKLIREEVRKALKENNLKPGFKGHDANDYPLTIVAGPFNSVEELTQALKTKYSKAADILRDKDLMADLKYEDASDVEGFFLVQGPDYGGSGFSVVYGEDIA